MILYGNMYRDGSHFARFSFDSDISRLDQLRLVLSSPLDGAFNSGLRVGHLPFGGTHVARVDSRIREEASFPRVVRVGLWEEEGG